MRRVTTTTNKILKGVGRGKFDLHVETSRLRANVIHPNEVTSRHEHEAKGHIFSFYSHDEFECRREDERVLPYVLNPIYCLWG